MRRNVIVSCALFAASLLGFAAGAGACQITCPDGSSCSVWFGTCVCFNDGHAYCFPEDPNFAAMSQPISRLADRAAVPFADWREDASARISTPQWDAGTRVGTEMPVF